MSPWEMAIRLVELVVDLIGIDHARAALDEVDIRRANDLADALEREKFK